MNVRSVYVATISAAERKGWPELAPFCGEPQIERRAAPADAPEPYYYVYAVDDEERDLLRRRIAELRLGEGRTDQSVEPCPYQAGDGTWIPKAYVFRRVEGKIVRTEVNPVEPVIFDSEASATAWSLALGQHALDRQPSRPKPPQK